MLKAFLVRKTGQHQSAPKPREEDSPQKEEGTMQVQADTPRPSPPWSPACSEGSSHIDVDYYSPAPSPSMTSPGNGEYFLFSQVRMDFNFWKSMLLGFLFSGIIDSELNVLK